MTIWPFVQEHEQIIPPSITVCSSASYKGVDSIYNIETQIFNNWPNNGTLVEKSWKGK